ncbi:hypothetical protein BOTBODRAFT_29754 [Botryobasidium botryosum FD-172 SS1]|uniref:DUF3752 domain-containing protein n=1 Tax=Botryobasidium botryosum (strain FD-172 SS1) TaxID=930990 RepID=A0A067MP84_BOTB1|nr:hypothetical protein BOTBODRAFT_29754 [Botryobasidium botryosum FD-172 SS1]
MPIGPQLPPHLQQRNPAAEDDEGAEPQLPNDESDDDADSFAPSLPPDLVVRKPQAGPAAPPPAVGPSFPTASSVNYPTEDDDDDDDYGPMPAPAHAGVQEEEDGVKEFLAREERRRKQAEEAAKPKKPQRDEWMLVPPTAQDLFTSLDPTKLRARQFSKATEDKKTIDNTLWTETPAERQARLADEVMGKRKRAAAPAGTELGEEEEAERKRARQRDEEIKKHIRQHNDSTRSAPLIELHSQATASSSKDEKDNAPPAIWDRDRDMGVGGRLMDDASRKKLIKDARGLGDRFGHGKRGGYL